METEQPAAGRGSTAVGVGVSVVVGASIAGVLLMSWSEKRAPGGSLDASNSLALIAGWIMWIVALIIVAAIWGITYARARRRRTRVVVSIIAGALVTLGLIGCATPSTTANALAESAKPAAEPTDRQVS